MLSTTSHAQDFRDEEGDRLVGRQTLPLAYPTLSRTTFAASLSAWSVVLAFIWDIDIVCASALAVLGTIVGVLYTVRPSLLCHVEANVRVS